MFGFRKKKPSPPLCDANPGSAVDVQFNFSTDNRHWCERVDLVRVAAKAFQQHGHNVTNWGDWLEHRESGFSIVPRFVDVHAATDEAIQTATSIQINHPTLAPSGIFEYQHSFGGSIAEATLGGIEIWLKTDFVTLLDATRKTPVECMVLHKEFPGAAEGSVRTRRAVLGPITHLATDASEVAEEHPFCHCCLFTRSFVAFQEMFAGDRLYALRLFASRERDGTVGADCRVNGEDCEPGALALRAYVASWPDRGFEFRKQYIVLQDAPPASA